MTEGDRRSETHVINGLFLKIVRGCLGEEDSKIFEEDWQRMRRIIRIDMKNEGERWGDEQKA